MQSAQSFIKQYQLQPHPEGGWYKETYRSHETIPATALPGRFSGERNFSTAIYFLLEQGNFSAFHKIQSDECWHFYAGYTLNVYVLHNDGQLEIIKLGNDIAKGELFQYVVPANCWFASRPSAGSEFCFVGCTVSPGFDFTDFEMAKEEQLLSIFPQHADIIKEMSR